MSSDDETPFHHDEDNAGGGAEAIMDVDEEGEAALISGLLDEISAVEADEDEDEGEDEDEEDVFVPAPEENDQQDADGEHAAAPGDEDGDQDDEDDDEDEEEDDDDDEDEDEESGVFRYKEAPVLKAVNEKILFIEGDPASKEELAAALSFVAASLEEEDLKFQRVNTEPNEDSESTRFQAVPVSYIGPLLSVVDSSRLPDLIVYRFLFDDNLELCTAAARCLLASGGRSIRYWTLDLTPEEERVYQRLYSWTKDAQQPLRTYATGLFAILIDCEVADLAVSGDLPLLLLRRLRERLRPWTKKVPESRKRKQPCSPPSNEKGKEIDEDPQQPAMETVAEEKKDDRENVLIELRCIVRCLAALAEYQEILPPLVQENAVDLLLTLLDLTDTFVLFDTMGLLSRLFAHRKFGHDFVDRGGLHALLQVPQDPYLCGSIALCFYGLSCLSTVMERILLFPEPLPSLLVKRTLWILGMPQDNARISAAHFMSTGVLYPKILELFDEDAMSGLKALIHILHTCLMRVHRGEEGDMSDGLPKRQIPSLILATTLCLKQYFRSHLLVKQVTIKANLRSIMQHKKRRESSRGALTLSSSSLGFHTTHQASSSIPPPPSTSALSTTSSSSEANTLLFPPNKPLDTDVNAAQLAIEYLIGSPFLEEEASDAEKGDRTKGVPAHYLSRSKWPHVDLFAKQDGYQVIFDIIRHSINWRYQEIPHFCLEIVYLTCLLPFVQALIVNTTLESGERGIGIILDAAGGGGGGGSQNPNKDPSRSHEFPEVMKAALSIVWVISGLSKDEETLRHVWKSIRASNGIRVLLSLLRIREPASHADAIRSLACRALLGISRDPTICQILSKLHITSRLLPDLMRDPILPDNISEHQQFKLYAVELINKIAGRVDRKETRKEREANLTINDAIDPTFSKFERARIVNNTPITYSSTELLQLVYEHLQKHGLSKTAKTLAEEAKLPPLTEFSEGRERGGRNTLDKMIIQYCVDQHKRCPAPIASLPPFNLLQPHRCPTPLNVPFPRGLKAPLNIASRLAAREFSVTPRHGGLKGGHLMRRLIYSRFRPVRVYRADESAITCAAFYDNRRLLAGTHDGDVKIFDIESTSLIGSWQCHDYSMVSLVPSDNRRHLLTFSYYDNGLMWDISTTPTDQQRPVHTLTDCKVGVFNHASTIIAGSDLHQRTILFSVQTGQVLANLKDEGGVKPQSPRFTMSGPCFSPFDDFILSDGVLWDPRYSRAIHKFDRLTNYGSGIFHPSGREVIINSEVWDLHTFKLLKTVPVLDKNHVVFNGLGDIIYGFPRKSDEASLQNLFVTLDASDYSHIATVDVEKTIHDLALDLPDPGGLDRPGFHSVAPDNYIAVVEYAPSSTYCDSVVRLYEVGRKKPDAYDSDMGDDDDLNEEFVDEADEDLMEDNDMLVDDFDEVDDFGDHIIDDEDDDDDDDDDGFEVYGEGLSDILTLLDNLG